MVSGYGVNERSRYNVTLKREDGGFETLATFKYYEDVMLYLKWKPELRTVFGENGNEDYNPNTGVTNLDQEFSLFNSPLFTPVDAESEEASFLSKREVAIMALGENATYDVSIPQPWADKIVDQCEGAIERKRYVLYSILFGGIVWYYPESSIFGMPAVLTRQALELMLWVYGGER